jgi:hypothetical protein
MADMKLEGMPATPTRAVLQPGRTRVSVRLECEHSLFPFTLNLIRAVSQQASLYPWSITSYLSGRMRSFDL